MQANRIFDLHACQHFKPMTVHLLQEFFSEGITGGGTDYGVNSTYRAERRCSLTIHLIYPLYNLRRRENSQTVETATKFAAVN